MTLSRQPDPTGQPAAPRRKRRILPLLLLIALFLTLALPRLQLRAREAYAMLRFGVRTVHSESDQDHDLIDDFSDIMLGARRYVRTKPEYVSAYFGGGYPPDGQGVCTDVLWRALKSAGYDFKALLDEDVAAHPSLYPLPDGTPDPNIDFRRVVNLSVYFERHCLSLTTDPTQIDQWQPGDVVFYEGHVAIVSDRRNADGQPWIIHHTGHGAFEEDCLTYRPILGHYRWVAP